MGITKDNTVEAKAFVGEGTTIYAVGNVDIGAQATISNDKDIEHWLNFVGFSKATTDVNGTIHGADINIHSDATSKLSYKNSGNPMDLTKDITGIDVNGKLTDAIWRRLQRGGAFSDTQDIMRNVIKQLYMPFKVTDAQATTTIGKQASLSSYIRGQYTDAEGKQKDVGGNLNVVANSVADNAMKIKLQSQLKNGLVQVFHWRLYL